jgi:plasmid stability protein
MKTTLDLPDDLLRAMKMQAVREGRKFKDVAAEIFRRGLGRRAPAASRAARHRVKLPLIAAAPDAPKFVLTGEVIDDLLMEEEVLRHHDSARH